MDELIRFAASTLIVLLFLVVPFLWYRKQRIIAIEIVLAAGTSWLVSQTIKSLFYTPRPYLGTNLETLVFYAPTDGAFPSSHTAASMALATIIWLYNKRAGSITFILALAIGFARVLAHVHYPIDIVGGALLGLCVSLIVHFSRAFFKTSKKKNNGAF